MGEWPIVRLGSLAAKTPGAIAIGPFGSKMKAETYAKKGVPVIRGTNISGERSWKGDWVYIPEEFADTMPNCNAFAGDLVFPHRGSIGEVAIVPDDGSRYMLSTSLMKFRPDVERASALFLFYYFRSVAGRNEILTYGSQVGTPGIGQPLSSLRMFRVPLPPLRVQKSIATILGALDDKIDLNRRMNETLEAMARALFKDWFVDFGPTRAKMEGREPYLAPELWALFPDRLDDEGTPEGWEIKPLLHYSRLISGGTPKTDIAAYWGGSIAWASAKDVSQCGETFLIATERSITEGGLEESSTRLIPKFATVVVARGATTGRHCLFSSEMAMNQTCYALTSTTDRPFSLYCAFGAIVGELVNSAHGSVFDTITTKTIERVHVTVPSEECSQRFEESVRPLFFRILANLKESRTLAQTRDLLLPKLMSGEIRVKEAEKIIEEVN